MFDDERPIPTTAFVETKLLVCVCWPTGVVPPFWPTAELVCWWSLERFGNFEKVH